MSCCMWSNPMTLFIGFTDGSIGGYHWSNGSHQVKRITLQDSSRVGRLWSSLTGKPTENTT